MMGTDLFFMDRVADPYHFPDPDPPFFTLSFADPDPLLLTRWIGSPINDRDPAHHCVHVQVYTLLGTLSIVPCILIYLIPSIVVHSQDYIRTTIIGIHRHSIMMYILISMYVSYNT